MSRTVLGLVVASVLTAAPLSSARVQAPPADGEWRTFEGSWSASGTRQQLPTEGGSASVVQLSGTVVLGAGATLGRGFRGELIGFDDGRDLSVGRWLWTDQRGDRIFGEVKGEPMGTGRRFVGTLTGGTGRYADLAGEFEFTWQYVASAEVGTVQGRTTTLKGRYRHERQ